MTGQFKTIIGTVMYLLSVALQANDIDFDKDQATESVLAFTEGLGALLTVVGALHKQLRLKKAGLK